MPRSILLAALIVAPLCGVASSAAAQLAPWDAPSTRGFLDPPRSGGHYEHGLWLGSTDAGGNLASTSGVLRLGMVLERAVEVRLTGGFSFADLDQGRYGIDGWHGAFANPTFSFFGILDERRWRLRLGGGLSLPGVPSTREAALSAYLAAATRGLSQLWLWNPQGLSPMLGVSFEAMPVDHLYVEAAVAGATLFDLGDEPVVPEETERPVDLTIDASAALGFRVDHVMAGLRGRVVFNPSFTDVNPIQSSLELFGRGIGRIPDTSIEIFGEARVTANLDPPLGFTSDPAVWGAFLSVGVSSTPAQIPDGRYGISEVHVEGMETLDEQSLTACLGTRARSRFAIDISLRGSPACGEPPFDGDHLLLGGWSWPWTEWPLFDESVFERDVERIERWFRARGYYDAEVLSTEVDPPAATAIDGATEDCGHGEGEDDCTADVTFEVREGEPVRIARMSLRGIDLLPDEMRQQLRDVLQFQRGDPFDEARYEITKQQMLRVLADAGYAHAEVDGEVKINHQRREAFLIFVIRPDLPNVIGRVCVSGHGDELPPEVMLAVADLDPAERFSLALLEESQRALYALGVFGAVSVSPHQPEEDEDETEDEEPREEITDREVVTREDVEVEVGEEEVYCQEGPETVPPGTEPVDIDIEVSPGRLERLGFGVGIQAGQSVTFGTIASYADQQDAAQWDLHLSFAYEHRNVFERLVRMRFEIRPRFIFQMPFLNFAPAQPLPFGAQLTGSMRVPSCLEARTNCLVQVRYDLGPEPFTGFYRSELDGLLGPERSFFDGRLYMGAFLHGNWFLPTDRQPIEPRDQLPQTFALWLEEAIRLDLRDDPRNPRAGAYFSVSSQQSVQPLSAWDMVRFTAEARGYLPLPFGIVLAGRFEIGMTHVFGFNDNLLDSNNVYQLAELGPTALHLRGGGASSNRGYLPGLLGDARQIYVTEPRSSAGIARGTPITQRPVRISGGTSLWEASVELRVPITANFGVVAFADAGDVVRPDLGSGEGPTFYFGGGDDGTFRPQLSFGLGIRYRTIVGPIRLDLAIAPPSLREFGQEATLPPTCEADDASRCNPRNYLDFGLFQAPGAFHLTIGESF
ncbi:MAG TPA: BamA/TamA family outer membrane protein [Sandaracinaceae bacterium LLY-WYZ-13_1]|nr:BamA/TamA family outer membrane protein [Sandaracinaceae bacterium LLY-WYZ-13_1]